jgi:putative endonuclease
MKRVVGRRGEDLAADYLIKQGFMVVERNYRCRWGEIDIICRQGALLIFVEVRSKSTDRYGTPEESITGVKISRIRKTALEYLNNHPEVGPVKLRFDFVAITFKDQQGSINHIKGAF